MEFRLLSWIDTWGEEVAWAIRVGLAVIGGALWYLGRRNEAAAAEQTAKSN